MYLFVLLIFLIYLNLTKEFKIRLSQQNCVKLQRCQITCVKQLLITQFLQTSKEFKTITGCLME